MHQQTVNDLQSNMEENLENWAKMLRHGGKNLAVFKAVYSSKKLSWSIAEIGARTLLDNKAASEASKALHDRGLFIKGPSSPIRYSKRNDVYRIKGKLLRLAGNPKTLAALPTKRKLIVKVSHKTISYISGKAIHITVDEIDNFAKVRKVASEQIPKALNPSRFPEEVFKFALEAILGERARLKDWGGENLDLFSTNVQIRNRRFAAGIALKGPAQTGCLTPRKMGVNGDQIDRLLSQSIQVAIVQYEGDIAPSVYSLIEKLSREKARSEEKNIYYCLINLLDSYRLRIAYPSAFAAAAKESAQRKNR